MVGHVSTRLGGLVFTEIDLSMRSSVGETVNLSSRLVGVNVVVYVIAGAGVAENASTALVQVDGVLAGISTGLDTLQDGLDRGQVVSSGSVEDNVALGRVLLNHVGVVEIAEHSLDAY